MPVESRLKIQEKVPLKILYRLKKRIQKESEASSAEILLTIWYCVDMIIVLYDDMRYYILLYDDMEHSR